MLRDNVTPDANNIKRTREILKVLGVSGSIQMNFKIISEYFKIKQVLTSTEKSSSSPSVIMITEFKDSKIEYYFKIFPDTDGYEKLNTEINMYNELYKLIESKETPNILCRVFAGKLGHFNTDFYNKLDFTRQSEIEMASNGSINSETDKVGIMITNPGGHKLRDVLKDIDVDELKNVFFQIFYTLYIFEKYKITHGDLHAENIFINLLDDPKEYKFNINGVVYKIYTNCLVKIYDFDRSRIHSTFELLNEVKNTDEYEDTTGNCFIFNNKLDILTFLTWGIIENTELYDKNKETFDIFYDIPECNELFKEILKGFLNKKETIRETYDRYGPIHLAELNRIMDLPLDTPYKFENYRISPKYATMTWYRYYTDVLTDDEGHGRPIKSPREIKNNQLWIPDEIVLPPSTLLSTSYFHSLRI